jgi:hypothetical protein
MSKVELSSFDATLRDFYPLPGVQPDLQLKRWWKP